MQRPKDHHDIIVLIALNNVSPSPNNVGSVTEQEHEETKNASKVVEICWTLDKN